MMLAFALHTALLLGGVPEPGMLLYGAVIDPDTGDTLTAGHIVWTYTSPSTGQTASVSAPLRHIDTPEGVLSYVVTIPLEDSADGFDDLQNRLLVTNENQVFVRSVRVNGAPASVLNGAPLTPRLTLDNRGQRERVDLRCDGCGDNAPHSADLDGNFHLDPVELQAGLDLFRASSTHVYTCDAESMTGYVPGNGHQTCFPHSSDYRDGADWRIDFLEITRLMELGLADDGYYCNDPLSEDGYSAGDCSGGASNSAVAPPSLRMTRRVVGRDATEHGITLDVVVRIELTSGPASVSIVGLDETLPSGWYYTATKSGPATILSPASYDSGRLEFAWAMTGAASTYFTYSVIVSQLADLNDAISGTSVLRSPHMSGPILRVVNGTTPTVADTDGDGINDEVESGFNFRDTDGDGIPDFIDSDSDNDGASDAWEIQHGTDPFDPAFSPPLPLTWALAASALALLGLFTYRIRVRRQRAES